MAAQAQAPPLVPGHNAITTSNGRPLFVMWGTYRLVESRIRRRAMQLPPSMVTIGVKCFLKDGTEIPLPLSGGQAIVTIVVPLEGETTETFVGGGDGVVVCDSVYVQGTLFTSANVPCLVPTGTKVAMVPSSPPYPSHPPTIASIVLPTELAFVGDEDEGFYDDDDNPFHGDHILASGLPRWRNAGEDDDLFDNFTTAVNAVLEDEECNCDVIPLTSALSMEHFLNIFATMRMSEFLGNTTNVACCNSKLWKNMFVSIKTFGQLLDLVSMLIPSQAHDLNVDMCRPLVLDDTKRRPPTDFVIVNGDDGFECEVVPLTSPQACLAGVMLKVPLHVVHELTTGRGTPLADLMVPFIISAMEREIVGSSGAPGTPDGLVKTLIRLFPARGDTQIPSSYSYTTFEVKLRLVMLWMAWLIRASPDVGVTTLVSMRPASTVATIFNFVRNGPLVVSELTSMQELCLEIGGASKPNMPMAMAKWVVTVFHDGAPIVNFGLVASPPEHRCYHEMGSFIASGGLRGMVISGPNASTLVHTPATTALKRLTEVPYVDGCGGCITFAVGTEGSTFACSRNWMHEEDMLGGSGNRHKLLRSPTGVHLVERLFDVSSSSHALRAAQLDVNDAKEFMTRMCGAIYRFCNDDGENRFTLASLETEFTAGQAHLKNFERVKFGSPLCVREICSKHNGKGPSSGRVVPDTTRELNGACIQAILAWNPGASLPGFLFPYGCVHSGLTPPNCRYGKIVENILGVCMSQIKKTHAAVERLLFEDRPELTVIDMLSMVWLGKIALDSNTVERTIATMQLPDAIFAKAPPRFQPEMIKSHAPIAGLIAILQMYDEGMEPDSEKAAVVATLREKDGRNALRHIAEVVHVGRGEELGLGEPSLKLMVELGEEMRDAVKVEVSRTLASGRSDVRSVKRVRMWGGDSVFAKEAITRFVDDAFEREGGKRRLGLE